MSTLQKVRALIRREFVASRMNNVKWHLLAQLFTDLRLEYFIKFVNDQEIYPMTTFWSVNPHWFDSSVPGAFLTLAIEWLDINPIYRGYPSSGHATEVVDCRNEIISRLETAHISYELIGSYIRIVAHVRKS